MLGTTLGPWDILMSLVNDPLEAYSRVGDFDKYTVGHKNIYSSGIPGARGKCSEQIGWWENIRECFQEMWIHAGISEMDSSIRDGSFPDRGSHGYV